MKKEFNNIKNKVDTENENARALNAEEAAQAVGGGESTFNPNYEFHLYTIETEEEMKRKFEK